MNIQTKHFSLRSDFLSRPELIRQAPVPDTFEAVSEVKSYLTRTQLLPPDVATAEGETTFLKVVGGELAEAVSFSDADFVRVNLRRFPIDGRYKLYSPAGLDGVVTAIVTGVFKNQDSVMELDARYQTVDYTQVETYPLRSTQSAWQVLQAGEGFIANPGLGERAIVRDVFLGYFESFDEQEYLQPIYVFTGDDGFLGYVSALDPRVVHGGTANVESTQ